MNWPLLPLIPELDDELGEVELVDDDEPGDVDDVLDPLAVPIDPFHEARHPVYVTVRPLWLLYDCDDVWPGCELGCDVVEGVCAPSITPANAMAPQVAKMVLVMPASSIARRQPPASLRRIARFAPRVTVAFRPRMPS
jgi:hypothetical protein